MKKIFKLISILIILSFSIVGCTSNKIIKEENLGVGANEQIENNNEEHKLQEDNNTEEIDNIKIETDQIEETKNIEYININPENVRIPILMYHSISDDDPNNSLLVPTGMFEEQMAWLEENSLTPMNMNEAIEAMNTGNVPKRPVVITFDDGYMDNYTNAFPSL